VAGTKEEDGGWVAPVECRHEELDEQTIQFVRRVW
jgi:hypothetical protein